MEERLADVEDGGRGAADSILNNSRQGVVLQPGGFGEMLTTPHCKNCPRYEP